MPDRTQGIVLRSIKYGDTSIVTTIFTAEYGVQAYMIQGVRSSKPGNNKAAFFQPGTLLDLVVYQQQQKNMQRIREFQAAYIYTTLSENVIKNTVLLFAAELLLRMLPEHAPLPSFFQSAYEFFVFLDKAPVAETANLPLLFMILCSRELGYELKGEYCAQTPYLNVQEGGFADHPPALPPYTGDEEARILSELLTMEQEDAARRVISSAVRMGLTDWYVAFLQQHTQHMGSIRSLPVLRAILH